MRATIGSPLTLNDCKMLQVIEELMKDVQTLKENDKKLLKCISDLETVNEERNDRVKSMESQW